MLGRAAAPPAAAVLAAEVDDSAGGLLDDGEGGAGEAAAASVKLSEEHDFLWACAAASASPSPPSVPPPPPPPSQPSTPAPASTRYATTPGTPAYRGALFAAFREIVEERGATTSWLELLHHTNERLCAWSATRPDELQLPSMEISSTCRGAAFGTADLTVAEEDEDPALFAVRALRLGSAAAPPELRP